MIIQCEQCRTKFKLDDEKVSDRGVKVRCAKCRHVFTVRKQSEAPAEATTEAVTAPLASFEGPEEAVTVSSALPPEQETFAAVSEPEETFSFDAATAETPAAIDSPIDNPSVTDQTGLTDDTGFSFGDISFTTEAPEATPAEGDVPSAPEAAEEPGFSFDDIPQSGTTTAESFDFSSVDFETVQSTSPSPVTEADSSNAHDVNFSSDRSAFMPDTPVPVPTGLNLAAQAEEPATRQPATVLPDSGFQAPVGEEEAPPLSISSRRRQSSVFSVLIGIITVLVVTLLGYMGYIFINDGPMALSLFGKTAATVEDGKITVQNVKAHFISTAAAGELLVITGDALNTYKKPRAALQVKALVFGANSQVLATKTAYAGNQLTNEQLVEMTAEKIETAMNNQFGDSLANLEVKPGKTIPFTVVIINPPGEGVNFGVEPAGSTVAAAK
jgi:predicted Zn finger-like uncharacterized protein